MKTVITSFLIMTAAITVLTLLLFAFLKLFGGKLSAKCRYILWCALIVEMCLPLPLFSAGIEHISAERVKPLATETISVYTSGIVDAAEKSLSYEPAVQPEKKTVGEPTVQPQKSEKPEAPVIKNTKAQKRDSLLYNISPLYAAFAVWIAGAAVTFVVILTKYAGFLKTVRRMKKAGMIVSPDDETYGLYRELCREMTIKNPPELFVAKEAISPVLFGFFRPKTVIPENGLTQEQKRAVLSHELFHYRRRDLIIKVLTELATSLFWFDPAVYLAAGELRKESELSCDEAVLSGKSPEYRIFYGEAMLSVVKSCKKNNINLISAFNSTGKKGVKDRFMNILNENKKSGGKGVIALILALCLITGGLVACTEYKENSPKKEKDNSPVWVPEGVYYSRNNGNMDGDSVDFVDVTLSYDGEKIIAERKINAVSDMSFELITKDGKLTSFNVYGNKDGKKTLRNTLTKKWDGENLTEELYCDSEGNVRYSKTYEYTDGKLMRENYDMRSISAVKGTVTYEYDSEGRIIKEISESTDEREPGNKVTTVTEYIYGEDGSVTKTVNGNPAGYSMTLDNNGHIISVEDEGGSTKHIYDEKGRFIGTKDKNGNGWEVKYYKGTDLAIHREYKDGDGKTVSYLDFDPETMLYKNNSGVRIKWREGTEEEKKAAEAVAKSTDDAVCEENTYLISGAWEQFLFADMGIFGGGLMSYSPEPGTEQETEEKAKAEASGTVSIFLDNLLSATPQQAQEHDEILKRAWNLPDMKTDETGIVTADDEELMQFVANKLFVSVTGKCLEQITAQRLYYIPLSLAKQYSQPVTASDIQLTEMSESGDSSAAYSFSAKLILSETGDEVMSAAGSVNLNRVDGLWNVDYVTVKTQTLLSGTEKK